MLVRLIMPYADACFDRGIVPLVGKKKVTDGMILINVFYDRGIVPLFGENKTAGGMILINTCYDKGTVPLFGNNVFTWWFDTNQCVLR